MSRGQKQQNGSSNGHGQQQTMQKRGNRTLGWYLGVQQNNGGNGPDEVEDNLSNQQPMRKISLEDSRSSAKFNNGEEQQRKSHRQHRCSQYQQQQMTRPRANSSASASKKPLNAIGGNQQPIHSGDISKDNSQIQQQNDFQKSAAKAMSGKENYWYYDLVSDGYYYEHNGTRGWRKRNAKLDAAIQNVQKGIEDAKIAEQQKKIVESAKAPLSLNVPSFMTGQQQSSKFGNIANNGGAAQFGNPMAIKYFDNDGYFYEMASVDGWRRRQPGLTPPNSLASSFGAAQPKAPSPINVPRRKIQPLQYQAYQQPPPQLNNLDLQEMIIMAQQQQNRNAGQHQHQNAVSCCCTQTQCCANSAAPACCTTIAAMAAQLVLQKQQQMMAENPSEFANKVKPLLEGLSNKSSASVGSSLHESKSSNRLVHSQLASNLTNNWQQFQHPGKWTPLGLDIAKNTNDEEKTTITVGSFDEPYEFYWSGDEASSEVVPKANAQQCDFIVGVPAATNINAASVSSTDEEGLEEMIKRSTKKRQSLIAPIGSETSAYGTNKKIDEKRRSQGESMQMKRPDTLKLTCQKPMNEPYVPISPGEIVMNPFGKENAAEDIMSSSHNFDVDKFISQLPPMPVNPEQILHSLRNPLRTPIGPPPSSMIEPSTADSPLFTPIHLGKNPWTYRLPENPWAYP